MSALRAIAWGMVEVTDDNREWLLTQVNRELRPSRLRVRYLSPGTGFELVMLNRKGSGKRYWYRVKMQDVCSFAFNLSQMRTSERNKIPGVGRGLAQTREQRR